MGPWGYVLAHRHAGAEAIAMLKYQGKTTYRSIIVTRPDVAIQKWPQDAEGLRISFDDVGNTSGYLVPTYWFLQHGINPKTYFHAYRDGAAPAANFVAVINDQTDLATGCDRCLDEYAAAGAFSRDAVKIVWRSNPLPNDAIAVRKGLDPKTVAELQAVVTSLTPDQARSLLPKNYTGFAPATNADYAPIRDAGAALGLLPKNKWIRERVLSRSPTAMAVLEQPAFRDCPCARGLRLWNEHLADGVRSCPTDRRPPSFGILGCARVAA